MWRRTRASNPSVKVERVAKGSRARRSMRQRCGGFTLLEVLVALLLLALAMVALVRAAGLEARALSQLQDATVAQWVASNVLAETRLTGRPPAQGRAEGQVDMAGRSWRWQLDAKATDEPGLVRLDVRVYDRAVSDGSTASSLTGFMQL
ncbi:MAG: type II secretion system minor pseudopilin GspI [Xanthomonadales bacterium]|nr:type II secretion system minor pseudopilin GspI [Xanthomonadales bacterium]